MKNIFLFLLFLFVPSLGSGLLAQCYSSVSLTDRLLQSEAVVTAQVLGSSAFYDDRGHIATRHQLRVLEVWKGQLQADTIDLVTLGGQIQEEMLVVSPMLQVSAGELGVFLLRQKEEKQTWPQGLNGNRPSDFYPYSALASKISIDTLADKAYDQGHRFSSLQELASLLSMHLGQPQRYENITAKPPRPAGQGRSHAMMPSITSFSPTTIAAGTNQMLTITGSGFGTTAGVVLFDSPHNGPGGAPVGIGGNTIQSWTDTEVVVNVTDAAGSGQIGIQNSSGQDGFSAGNLSVTYSIISLSTGSAYINGRLIDHPSIDDGGYTLLVSSSTANSGVSLAGHLGAMAALERAIASWQNDADYGIYAADGCGTTTIQEPLEDGFNIISFDNSAYDIDTQLGDAVAGVAFSYYSQCGSSEFEVSEIDIILRRDGDPNGMGGSIDWHFGTGAGGATEVSFEAVVLHEIGHTLQLNHVNDASQSMHYAVSTSSPITSPGTSDLAGATYIQNVATSYTPPIVNCAPAGNFGSLRQYEGYLTTANCAARVPVTYLFFSAARQEKTVRLNWATATEENNARFIVERSGDARQFQPIATLAGHGNSQNRQDYQSTDTAPLAGTNYYRLAQIDYDGSTAYSEVRSVRFDEAASALQLFPNPVQQQLQVQTASSPQSRIWQLLDTNGRLVKTGQLAAATTQTTIPISELPTGVYWWKLEGEGMQRIIKK